MGALKRLDGTSVSESSSADTERLALYEKFGAMAYGVILQIIPQPELAQQVLVDLFASPEIDQCLKAPTSLACNIIRLARTKALEANRIATSANPLPTEPQQSGNDNTEKLIFDLSFRQGYALGAIAEQLQMPYADVMKSIRDYFKYLRTS
jgi:hypothetical protein